MPASCHTYHTVGLMSGTSLDGLDIAYCVFTLERGKWSFRLEQAITVSYPSVLQKELEDCTSLSALELHLLDIRLGKWMGQQTAAFINGHKLKVDLVASHGHTVFHQPQKGLTLQIGNGWELQKRCGVTVVHNFRAKDVSLGGQGAPLVPIGDLLLFGQFDACLNLGGIANVSFEKNNQRVAYDIVPVNMVLNQLSRQVGDAYDKGGNIARSGQVNDELLNELNTLPYYNAPYPKSLGYEWVMSTINPILAKNSCEVRDKLATVVEHIAIQLGKSLPSGVILITGGGAKNTFLMERLSAISGAHRELTIPDTSIIDYKESLIFALLGVLRYRNEINCLKSVTGAIYDSSAGVILSKI